MKWVTRSFPHIDRTASAWLIKKFIDSKAEFNFINWPDEELKPSYGIPFDIKGVELGHHQGKCTFETIVEKYKIKDPIVQQIARLVHAADIKGSDKEVPEAICIKTVFSGLRLLAFSDHETIELGYKIWDAIYACYLTKMVEEKFKEKLSEMGRTEKLKFLRNKIREMFKGRIL